MKKAKKILSLMLVMLMLVSAVPMVANATDRWDVINSNGVSGDKIVAQARTYLGVPYDTSGGNYKYRTGFGDTMMFDCSGFVYRVCRDVGLASSRKNYTMGLTDPNGKPLEGQDSNGNYYITAHTQEQRYYGEDISTSVKKYIDTGDYSELKAGDLLFITNNNSSVSHVVIYSGEGTIVHSEGGSGVSEHNINRYHSNNNKTNWYFAGCRLVKDEIKIGDIIEFGSYPQTEVKDTATINALNALAPAWDKWTSYGYYSGDGNIGSMKQGDWMRYTDVVYNGVKYRGVKFTQYRPDNTCQFFSSTHTYQDDNGYIENFVYWFKFEPLSWRILDPYNGLIMCENIIDSQPYNNTVYHNNIGYYNDPIYKSYANDYKTSFIRKWLNDDFYNAAFTDKNKQEIKNTTLNNAAPPGYEEFDSSETMDKIFILSYNDVFNTEYGFSLTSNADITRTAQGSDYAKSQGLWVYKYSDSIYEGNSSWLLRSPGIDTSICNYIQYAGNVTGVYGTSTTYQGIRPAIVLKNLDVNAPCKHSNSVNNPQINPNCIDIGFTAGVYCNDCETWISGHETIAVSDHKDNNGDGKCDTCLKQLTSSNEPEQKEVGNFFTKIIDFFKNLFNKFLNLFR